MERWISFVFCIAGVLAFATVIRAQDPRGTPGVDYPNYVTIPETSFKCSEQKYNPGFYADLETNCQAFHFCYQDRQESFLCPTGTIFNQAVLTCDVWYKSNCSLSQISYTVNAGPIMERAGKNLPMLLRLRNSSQKKPSAQTATASAFGKVSSSYQTDNGPLDTSKDLKAKTNEKNIESFHSDFGKDNEQMISDKLDSEKDASEETAKESSNESELDQEMDTNLVYDYVDDGYYGNHDQYEGEFQNSEPVNEEFENFYDYRDPDNEYEADAESDRNDYMKRKSFKDSDMSVIDDSGYSEFNRRSSQRASLRVRRRPTYLVLDDKLEVHTGKTAEPVFNQEFDTLDKRETTEDKQNPTKPVEDETSSSEYFLRSSAVPHSLLNTYSEIPTSDESESAIWTDRIFPDNLNDFEGPVNAQSDVQDTSVQSDGSLFETQSDDTIYIENDLEPESYIPYVSEYEEVAGTEPGDEAYAESYSEFEEQKETDFSGTEDTFVVIPDEYDDNAVYTEPNEDFEMQGYPEETAYRTQMLEDPLAGYRTYESPEYSSIVDYRQHNKHLIYPEIATGMHQNEMPNDHAYSYETGYELQRQLPTNYESSDFEAESLYSRSDLYPYAETELSNTGKPLQLPVAEDDTGSLSDDFLYVLDDQPEVETWRNTGTEDNNESGFLVRSDTREGKQMNPASESIEEATPSEEPFPRPTPIPHSLLNISSETPMTSEELESAIWKDLILPGIPDDYEGPILHAPREGQVTYPEFEESETQSDTQSDYENIYNEKDGRVADSKKGLIDVPGKEPLQPEDVYYVFDFEQSSKDKKIKTNEDENRIKEYSSEISGKADERNYEIQQLNSSNEYGSMNVSSENESERYELAKTSDRGSEDQKLTSKDEQIKPRDVKTESINLMNTESSSNLGYSKPVQLEPETLKYLNNPFSTNMGNLDFSADSRFLNNMGYSESMDFGPYGFGPNMGQFSMMESEGKANGRFSQRLGQTEQPKLSSLSAIQEKVRSMKQGKFGAFKKYMSSTRK